MEPLNKDEKKTTQRKKGFLSRLGHRITKAFTKSKQTNKELKEGDNDISKSCLEDMPVTSKSHDNLKMKEEPFKTKRKKFGGFLKFKILCFRKQKRIPPKTDRCLSEGDLTRDEDKFYSSDSSPKTRKGRTHNDSSENDTSLTDTHDISVNNDKFKKELALKLKGKTPKSKKDDESDSSKTPDSPTGNCTGTSPSGQFINGSRTPYSLSSLSHSSNSLLSGNVACNYGTSDGESMSRSVIDSTDDIGIVVDLTTPISKTTTASLLDSTAARQKIAAARPRRARPKANDNGKLSPADKLKDSGSFSPVRENRDILEEISEEDCQPASNSPTIMDEDSITNPCSNDEIDANITLSIAPEEPLNTKPIPNEKTDNIIIVPSKEIPKSDPTKLPADINSAISKPSSIIVLLPNESGDSIVTNIVIDNIPPNKNETELKTTEVSSHWEGDVKSKFMMNKSKFQDNNDKPNKQGVTVRSIHNKTAMTTSDTSDNELSKIVLKRTSWAPNNKVPIETTNEIRSRDDDSTTNKVKINRYNPMNSSKINNTEASTTDHENLLTTIPNLSTSCPDKRKSRVLDMIKNLESVS